MILDETVSQLFFAVLPVFVASLPRPVLVSEDQIRRSGSVPNGVQAQLAVHNAIVRLRQAIRDLRKCFDPAYSGQHLEEGDHTRASDALEDMLCGMERLVRPGILKHRTIDQKLEKNSKLVALRDLVGDSPWPNIEEEPAVPPKALKWVAYLQHENPATEAVQYRNIAILAEQLNEVMKGLFNPEDKFLKPTAACLMGSSRPSQKIDEEKQYREALQGAKNLRAFTRKISSLIHKPGLGPCTPPHIAMIHLNGFDKLELASAGLDTMITVCGTKKAEKWQAITWIDMDPAGETAPSTICDKIRSSRQRKTRLRVHVGADSLWSGKTERRDTFAEKPALTLDSALNPEQGHLLEEMERLDLAIKIARSLFCLIWNPLVCGPWKSSNIHILKQQGQSLTVQPYIEGQMHVQNTNFDMEADGKSRRSLILDVGVILWELLLPSKIVVTPEDERPDEDECNDDVDPIFNALAREHNAARTAPGCNNICLYIIGNCLDLYYIDDEFNSTQLQSDIYHKIVRPLWDYIETYDESTSSASSRPCIPSPTPTQRGIQSIKRSSPSARSMPAKRLRTAHPVSMTIPKIQSPPPTSSTSTTAVLLTSNGTISSSKEWLERFDRLKQPLQEALSFSIKIAILDTGCDIENDFFAGPGISFIDDVEAGWVDYVDGKPTPCDEDAGKHGTALSALLLRLIPSCAKVRVARVARNATKLEDAKENIAKAILEAISWEADIICMSFGFGSESPVVKEAIVKAEMKRHDRIIFFAASNNDGLNEPELFPAWLESVISVRGTLHDGEFKQKYNPTSWGHETGLPQYGTLAVDVRCAWTTDDLDKSGCSFATPIMAAIAAIAISYVGTYDQNFDSSHKDLVRTRRGILSVFLEMTAPYHGDRADRRYLAPWFLFNQGSPIDLLRNALRKVPQRDHRPR